jgi:branched-chain amino acid transport system permease protein
MDDTGIPLYIISLLTMGGVYAVLALGLNIQWGFTGLFNAGVAGFFAVGAYASAILTGPPLHTHLGGFELPIPVGLVVAMIISGILGYAVGRLTLTLRSDYLAIATIGIAEILRLMVKNEDWLTNGPRGIRGLPRPFDGIELSNFWEQLSYLVVIALIVLVIYMLMERARNSPWGRVMRAIRENEDSARAAGKDIVRFRMEAFVIGSMIMGLGGALFAHSIRFIGPEATEPLQATTELLTRQLPPDWSTRTAYLRVFLIGLALQLIIQRFSQGLLAEKPPKPVPIEGFEDERQSSSPTT